MCGPWCRQTQASCIAIVLAFVPTFASSSLVSAEAFRAPPEEETRNNSQPGHPWHPWTPKVRRARLGLRAPKAHLQASPHRCPRHPRLRDRQSKQRTGFPHFGFHHRWPALVRRTRVRQVTLQQPANNTRCRRRSFLHKLQAAKEQARTPLCPRKGGTRQRATSKTQATIDGWHSSSNSSRISNAASAHMYRCFAFSSINCVKFVEAASILGGRSNSPPKTKHKHRDGEMQCPGLVQQCSTDWQDWPGELNTPRPSPYPHIRPVVVNTLGAGRALDRTISPWSTSRSGSRFRPYCQTRHGCRRTWGAVQGPQPRTLCSGPRSILEVDPTFLSRHSARPHSAQRHATQPSRAAQFYEHLCFRGRRFAIMCCEPWDGDGTLAMTDSCRSCRSRQKTVVPPHGFPCLGTAKQGRMALLGKLDRGRPHIGLRQVMTSWVTDFRTLRLHRLDQPRDCPYLFARLELLQVCETHLWDPLAVAWRWDLCWLRCSLTIPWRN